jgi:hypothetical protein
MKKKHVKESKSGAWGHHSISRGAKKKHVKEGKSGPWGHPAISQGTLIYTPLEKKPKKTERVNTGKATNDLVHSAYQEMNDAVFPKILSLFVPEGSKIADVTYGRGVFWKKVDLKKYSLHASDLKRRCVPAGCTGGIDSRNLPYKDKSFFAIVFDPPYMHTPGGTAHNGHQNYEAYYANNAEQDPEVVRKIWDETNGKPPKYHEAVLDLYYRAAREAWRVLQDGGIYIVKCQDEVCTNRQRLTHVEITVELQKYGFVVEDLFIVMRKNRPGVSRMLTRQYHARKNHSYFMVYRKPELNEKKPVKKASV